MTLAWWATNQLVAKISLFSKLNFSPKREPTQSPITQMVATLLAGNDLLMTSPTNVPWGIGSLKLLEVRKYTKILFSVNFITLRWNLRGSIFTNHPIWVQEVTLNDYISKWRCLPLPLKSSIAVLFDAKSLDESLSPGVFPTKLVD